MFLFDYYFLSDPLDSSKYVVVPLEPEIKHNCDCDCFYCTFEEF